MAELFRYEPEVLARYPTVRAGVLVVELDERTGDNGPSPQGLQSKMDTAVAAARTDLADRSLADLPSVSAWRRVFSSFGVKPTKYRNAVEALLRRLTKGDELPRINTLVDIGNLASVSRRVPVAVFDLDRVAAPAIVRIADGSETFHDLGSNESTTPDADEVVFVDAGGSVITRRWCWRQNRASAASPATRRALVVTEGHHEAAADDVAACRDDIAALVVEFLPGARVTAGELDPDRPRFVH